LAKDYEDQENYLINSLTINNDSMFLSSKNELNRSSYSLPTALME